jgi:hypothetical protein
MPLSITHEINTSLLSNHFLHPSNVWTLITNLKDERGNKSWGTIKETVVLVSGFRREAPEICALLGYYAASSGKFLPTFRNNLSVPSSGLKNWILLRMGPICCPETSERTYHYSLRNNPEERSSQMVVFLYRNQVSPTASLTTLFSPHIPW